MSKRVTFEKTRTGYGILVAGERIGECWSYQSGQVWAADTDVDGNPGDIWLGGAKTRADAVRALLVLLRIEAEVC